MRFLVLNTDYDDFLRQLYEAHSGLESHSYAEQMRVRMDSWFGTADFYSTNLTKLGHEAYDVIVNAEAMQRQWAREHGVDVPEDDTRWQFRLRRGIVPWVERTRTSSWMYRILEAQIKFYKPDVIYCMAIETIDSSFLRSVNDCYRLAVGQHAAPIPTYDLSAYDLILSSLPNQVEYFRGQGLKSEYLPLGFEPRILNGLHHESKQYDVAFIGGLGGVHQAGTQILEQICQRYSVKVWGYGVERLPLTSAIRASYNGTIWGREMYQALHNARIVFNRHIDVADGYANNMRLYETTGTGTFLLTDEKKNLRDLFAVPDEVQAYGNAEECVRLIDYYIGRDEEREAIAVTGQKRTLSQHNWLERMKEMLEIVGRYE